MKLWQNLVSLLHTLAYGWVGSLRHFVAMLRELHKQKPKRPSEHRPPAKSPCVPIDHPAFVRPDPMIYSQRALMDQGLAVTWDNPDITLFKSGAPVSSAGLEPGTTYDVQARIWNNSLEAPVVRMPVHLSYLDFGIGTEPIPIASGKVDVGVKGSASQPAFVSIPWTTPTTPGHYCLQVQLDPADDTDMSNNLGQENTDVVAAHSPATFTFTLRNNTKHERAYRFETDGYEIPQRLPCGERREDQGVLLDRHRRERHPVPAGFAVQIAPPDPTIAPGAAITVTVTVEPPAGFLGRQAINVNAFHGQGVAGGVTLTTVKEA
jgi:hypothetical protein